MLANVTSVTQHLAAIKTIPADIVATTETKLSRGGQKLADLELPLPGDPLMCTWGHQMPTRKIFGKRASAWDATQGGVGVLARARMLAQRVPENCPMAPVAGTGKTLYEDGRYRHTAFAIGAGTTAGHLLTYSGWSGARQDRRPAKPNNEEGIRQLFE